MSVGEIAIDEKEVKEEFYLSTYRFQTITCWVGLILNLVWTISDYFVIAQYWYQFLIFRIIVSSVTLIALFAKRLTGINIYQIIFILAVGISVQNAYMWSVMDLELLQKHTFAYMALFLGVGMLVYWEYIYSKILIIITVLSNYFFFKYNGHITRGEFLVNGGLLLFTVAVFSAFLVRTRYKLMLNEISSRLQLARSKQLIEEERNIVVEQKREITDSINYAKRIQEAFIPTEEAFNSYFKESFVLFKPKDIVSGDFYWVHKKDEFLYYATADCTGHGVPGGFMTMLGLSYLEEIVQQKEVFTPAQMLNLLRDKIVNTLKQGANSSGSKDGMDIILCRINMQNNMLNYAAANNSFYVVRNNELLNMKADKQPCGFSHNPTPFTNNEFELEPSDYIYTSTDGYADQFGGPKGKKFKQKQLKELILQHHSTKMENQKNRFAETFLQWKSNLEQVDDVLLIGVKV